MISKKSGFGDIALAIMLAFAIVLVIQAGFSFEFTTVAALALGFVSCLFAGSGLRILQLNFSRWFFEPPRHNAPPS